MGIEFLTYTESIGPVSIDKSRFSVDEIYNNSLYMPDAMAAASVASYLEKLMAEKNSCGGVIYCEVTGLPVGLGEPVFDKIDANLAKAMFSIGSVKGFEIGDGFGVATSTGLENNDAFCVADSCATSSGKGRIAKATNHSGGTLGGMTDGAPLTMRVAIKPTPSIASVQKTMNTDGEEIEIEIKGRHDPIIVPRAVVVVEAMAAITILDAVLENMGSRLERVLEFYK